MEERGDKVWPVHAVGHYSAIEGMNIVTWRSVKEGHMLSDSMHMKCPDRSPCRDRKQVHGCPGLGGGRREQPLNEYGVSCGGDENVLEGRCVAVLIVHTQSYIRSNGAFHLTEKQYFCPKN